MKTLVNVQKSHVICAAHRLMNHPGKCRNLHGHNYKITYYLGPIKQPIDGMVMDFGDIKKYIFQPIEDAMDHKVILHKDDPLVTAFSPKELFLIDHHPTAENMAIGLLGAVQALLDEHYNNDMRYVVVMRIDIEETPGAIATAVAYEKYKGEKEDVHQSE